MVCLRVIGRLLEEDLEMEERASFTDLKLHV